MAVTGTDCHLQDEGALQSDAYKYKKRNRSRKKTIEYKSLLLSQVCQSPFISKNWQSKLAKQKLFWVIPGPISWSCRKKSRFKAERDNSLGVGKIRRWVWDFRNFFPEVCMWIYNKWSGNRQK